MSTHPPSTTPLVSCPEYGPPPSTYIHPPFGGVPHHPTPSSPTTPNYPPTLRKGSLTTPSFPHQCTGPDNDLPPYNLLQQDYPHISLTLIVKYTGPSVLNTMLQATFLLQIVNIFIVKTKSLPPPGAGPRPTGPSRDTSESPGPGPAADRPDRLGSGQ
eukprot:765978-Hanusia_phi.AAC.1